MARLIPKIDVEDIGNKPERDVARALLEQLPQDCVVYHSYPWLKADRNDKTRTTTLREGEVDFIIILPSHGFLVVEVKGGRIHYEPDNRGWFRVVGDDDVRAIQDPIEQARRNTHYLIDEIKRLGYVNAQRPPFAYGYAIIFPDCDYTGPPPPGGEPAVIFAARDLPHLDRRIREVLRSWSRAPEPYRLEQYDKDTIQKAISPAFQLLPVLYRQLDEQEEKLVRLTEEQQRLLLFLDQRPRAAIQGVAGSGKTMLARAQAQRFADEGCSVLFTCFNKGLAHWLEDLLPATYGDRVTIRHFHALCDEWCREAGIEFVPNQDDLEKFWRDTAPEKLLDSLDMIDRRFDAIVVDEGQDFYPNWWLTLEALNAQGHEGSLYIFFDPAQNLFVADGQALPNMGEPYVLPTNCRNTRRIAETCGGIIEQTIAMHEHAPVGDETRYFNAPTNKEQIQLCGDMLQEWINKGRLHYSQIVILSPLRKQNSSLADADRIAKHPIVEDQGAWQRNEGVLFSTIRSFKGLEADAVILIDAPEPDARHYFGRTDYYVACSRAKHLLAVIRKAPE